MKKSLKFLPFIVFIFFTNSNIYSQFNVLNKVKKAVTDRVSNQVDKVVNRQIDSIEKKVTDKQVNKVNEALDKQRNEIIKGNEPNSDAKVISNATGVAKAVVNSKGKGKFAIKSAIVQYTTNSMGFAGNQTLYFDNYGEKEATETLMEVMGFKAHTLLINGDNCSYNVDLVKKTATKTSTNDNPYGIDFQQLSTEMQNDWKIQKEGNEIFLGKDCMKYSISNVRNTSMNGTFWVWNGIPLKTDMNMISSKITLEAVKIEENANVPSDKFEIPGDVSIAESE